MALPGAGGIVTAADLRGGPAIYIPTLTATTTNPTLGVGATATGSYARIGQKVTGEARFRFGTSGVNAGSGTYQISLPLAPSGTHHDPAAAIGVGSAIGSGQLRDNSSAGSTWRTCTMLLASLSGTGLAYIMVDLAGLVSDAVPWTWAASDGISVHFSYIAAG